MPVGPGRGPTRSACRLKPPSPSPASIPRWQLPRLSRAPGPAASACLPPACVRSGSDTGSRPPLSPAPGQAARDRDGRCRADRGAACATSARPREPARPRERRSRRRFAERRPSRPAPVGRGASLQPSGVRRRVGPGDLRRRGILPGSLYYHFKSKEDLFVTVHAEGFREINAAVDRALDWRTDPWERLEAACAAHLAELVSGNEVAVVTGTSLFQPAARAPATPQPRARRVRRPIPRPDRPASPAARRGSHAAQVDAVGRLELDANLVSAGPKNARGDRPSSRDDASPAIARSPTPGALHPLSRGIAAAQGGALSSPSLAASALSRGALPHSLRVTPAGRSRVPGWPSRCWTRSVEHIPAPGSSSQVDTNRAAPRPPRPPGSHRIDLLRG